MIATNSRTEVHRVGTGHHAISSTIWSEVANVPGEQSSKKPVIAHAKGSKECIIAEIAPGGGGGSVVEWGGVAMARQKKREREGAL